MERREPRPIDQFDMKEIYRLINLERIPGFNLLGKERALLAEYREALKRQTVAEDFYEIERPDDAPKIVIKTAPAEETGEEEDKEPEEKPKKKRTYKRKTTKKIEKVEEIES